nr:alpha/beta fold hydrolase [uncultured Albidiferax sp.]
MTDASLPAASTTATYYDAHAMTRFLRWGLRALQQVSPALALRSAYRLFGTPLPLKWRGRQHAWGSAWQTERWGFEQASLTVYSLPAADHVPSVLLLHGWGGHAAQMLPLAQALAAQGMRPVLVEMPAHGRSDGQTSNLAQFSRAIDYVSARLLQDRQPLRAVVAHSLAANAAAFVLARGLPAAKLVLLAPPASPRQYTHQFAQVFGLREALRAALQQRLEAREGVVMTQFEPAAVGPRIRAQTLVVHDRGDRVNRFADGLAYSQAIPRARLVETQGLGHRRMLQDPGVLAEVAAFVAA